MLAVSTAIGDLIWLLFILHLALQVFDLRAHGNRPHIDHEVESKSYGRSFPVLHLSGAASLEVRKRPEPS